LNPSLSILQEARRNMSRPVPPAAIVRDAALQVYLLGLVDFESCLKLQQHLVYELSGRNDRQGTVLICEHPPVITIGREGSRAHLRCEPQELVAREVGVRWLNRGGGCLVHVPGQLAIYPILPLQRIGMGLADYRQALEKTLLGVCEESRVAAWQQASDPGIWCRSGQLGFLGAAVKSWISYHGAFLNVAPDLDWMQLCQVNSVGRRSSSLSVERLRQTSMHGVRESVARLLAAACGYHRYHIYTGHPLLRRTKKVIAYA
jgi:lipoyl(octanoyl) transferase